eukprot:7382082-Prymnesium_polylepis.4
MALADCRPRAVCASAPPADASVRRERRGSARIRTAIRHGERRHKARGCGHSAFEDRVGAASDGLGWKQSSEIR